MKYNKNIFFVLVFLISIVSVLGANDQFLYRFNNNLDDEFGSFDLSSAGISYDTPSRTYNQFGYGQQYLKLDSSSDRAYYDGVTILDYEDTENFSISFDIYINGLSDSNPILFLFDSDSSVGLNNLVFFQEDDDIYLCALSTSGSDIELVGVESPSDSCFQLDDKIVDGDLLVGWNTITIAFEYDSFEYWNWEATIDSANRRSGTLFLDSYSENGFNDICIGFDCNTDLSYDTCTDCNFLFTYNVFNNKEKIYMDNLRLHNDYIDPFTTVSEHEYIYNFSELDTPDEYEELTQIVSLSGRDFQDNRDGSVNISITPTFDSIYLDSVELETEYRLKGTSEWNSTGFTNITSDSGNEIIFEIENLDYFEVYEYRFLVNKTITYDSLLWWQYEYYSIHEFDTEIEPTILIDDISPSEEISGVKVVPYDEFEVSCEIIFEPLNTTNISYNVFINDTETEKISVDEAGVYSTSIGGLEPITQYEYKCGMYYNNITDGQYNETFSDTQYFETSYYPEPDVLSVGAEISGDGTITELEGRIDFVGHEYIETYFAIGQNGDTPSKIDESLLNITSSSTRTFEYNTNPDELYNFSICADYKKCSYPTGTCLLTANDVVCSEVLEFSTYVPPTIIGNTTSIGFGEFTFDIVVDMGTEDNTAYGRVEILDMQDNLVSAYKYFNTSIDTTESFNITGLENGTRYKYIGYLNYTNDDTGEYEIVDTGENVLRTKDIIGEPKDIDIFGFIVHIENPYIFQLFVILFTTAGMLMLSMITKGGNENASKILIWGTTGLVLFELVLLRLNEAISNSQILLSIFGIVMFLTYFIINEINGDGGVYG